MTRNAVREWAKLGGTRAKIHGRWSKASVTQPNPKKWSVTKEGVVWESFCSKKPRHSRAKQFMDEPIPCKAQMHVHRSKERYGNAALFEHLVDYAFLRVTLGSRAGSDRNGKIST